MKLYLEAFLWLFLSVRLMMPSKVEHVFDYIV